MDLAGGHQPMSNESGSQWITYNGEIFNHALLRPDLERPATLYHPLRYRNILHAYEEQGADCVKLFRGMFAFRDMGRRNRQTSVLRPRPAGHQAALLLLGRSRTFAFASEIKALLEHPSISPSSSDSLLAEYLGFGYTSGERTLFRDIRKLMPGHICVWICGEARPEIDITPVLGCAAAVRTGEASLALSGNGSRRPASAWRKPFACG